MKNDQLIPKVSVIIPTHNRPEAIVGAVRSVLSQTYQDLELIVVDVGLEARAEAALASFNDPRLLYLKIEEEKNGSAARNIGIKYARGKFIAFLDDDDEWIPEKLKIQMTAFEPTPLKVGFCFSAVTMRSHASEYITTVAEGVGDYYSSALERFNAFLTVTLIVKRYVFDRVGLFDESLPSHQDIDLIIRVAKHYQGLGINLPLVNVTVLADKPHVGGDLKKKIIGRTKILEKYQEAFKQRPAVLAKNYFDLGVISRQLGRFAEARQFIRKALATKFQLRYLFHYISLGLGGVPYKLYSKFGGLWRDSEVVHQRIARGGFLLFFTRGAIKLIQLAETIVIARLLFPNDVGLFALASLTLSLADIVFQTGFNTAIVQDKSNVTKHLNSAWTVNVIRGVFLTAIMYIGAPYFGTFFHNQDIIPIARALSLTFVITGFQNIGTVLLEKEMKFNRLFFYNVLANAAQVVLTIIYAFMLRNVWALVVGALALRVASLILSYLVHSFRPRFSLDMEGARYLFRFGKWIGIAGIISFFVGQGDSLVIGRLLDTSSLAFYNMAFTLGTVSAVEIVSTASGLLLPLYSHITDVDGLKNVFLKVSRIMFGVMMPATVGLLVLAPQIIRFFYGERWLPMVPILYVIGVYGLVITFDYLAKPLFQGVGKPQTPLVSLLVQALVMFSIIVPLTERQGAVGTAWAMVVGLVAAQLVLLWKIKKEIKIGPMTFLASIGLPAIASGVMGLTLVLLKRAVPMMGIASVLAYVLLGMVIYFIILGAVDTIFGREFYNSLRWVKRNI